MSQNPILPIRHDDGLKEMVARLGIHFELKRWVRFPAIVAVSGGPDSVALLRVLAEVSVQFGGWNLTVAHVNHGVRSDADNDEDFVRSLAAQAGFPVRIAHLERNGPVSEQLLRQGRYRCLERIATQQGARYIATGHTLDDQVETILFRLFRGTGVEGLSGIPVQRKISHSVTLIRPLLHTRRHEILELLDRLAQPFCHDATNDQTRITRNFIRHELLPLIVERFGDSANDAVARLGHQAARVSEFIESLSHEQLGTSIRHQTSDLVKLQLDQLQAADPILIRQFLKRIWIEQGWPQQSMDRRRWLQLVRMVKRIDATEVIQLPGAIDVRVCNRFITLSRLDSLEG